MGERKKLSPIEYQLINREEIIRLKSPFDNHQKNLRLRQEASMMLKLLGASWIRIK